MDAGEELKIVGIVQPRPDAKATALSMGIYYTPELTRHLIEQASEAAIVQEQLNYPTIDVFNGKEFTEEEESGLGFLYGEPVQHRRGGAAERLQVR